MPDAIPYALLYVHGAPLALKPCAVRTSRARWQALPLQCVRGVHCARLSGGDHPHQSDGRRPNQ